MSRHRGLNKRTLAVDGEESSVYCVNRHTAGSISCRTFQILSSNSHIMERSTYKYILTQSAKWTPHKWTLILIRKSPSLHHPSSH